MRVRIITLVVGVLSFGVSHAVGQSEGDVVISEIMYSPAGPDGDKEYIEVYNATDQKINLKGWDLMGEDPGSSSPSFDDITEDVQVSPGGFVVLCENGDQSENGGVSCAYDYANRIDHTNSNDVVALRDPSDKVIDEVDYNEEGSWPEANDASLEFVESEGTDNSIPSNWAVADERAGDYSVTTGQNKGSPNANAPGGKLPVELISFVVSRSDQRAVLEWKTASETNNAGFRVQHRSPTDKQWARVDFVDGHGTTQQRQSYRFTTGPLESGRHQFRLAQVDMDGTEHLSPQRTIVVSDREGLRIQGATPLRRGERTRIQVQTQVKQDVEVAVYDVLGRRVKTLAAQKVAPGDPLRTSISATRLSSGAYFIRASASSFVQTRRITVIR